MTKETAIQVVTLYPNARLWQVGPAYFYRSEKEKADAYAKKNKIATVKEVGYDDLVKASTEKKSTTKKTNK